jgi:hypothetical protein
MTQSIMTALLVKHADSSSSAIKGRNGDDKSKPRKKRAFDERRRTRINLSPLQTASLLQQERSSNETVTFCLRQKQRTRRQHSSTRSSLCSSACTIDEQNIITGTKPRTKVKVLQPSADSPRPSSVFKTSDPGTTQARFKRLSSRRLLQRNNSEVMIDYPLPYCPQQKDSCHKQAIIRM